MTPIARVSSFIASHWRETERFHPMDQGTLIGLPYPYLVPCRTEAFQELYYWDTYFTCLGLWRLGEKEAVLNNLRNFLFEVKRFGFIPNGSRTYYLNRSQPPYLAALVRLVWDSIEAPELKKEIVEGLKAEHQFWTSRRGTPCASIDTDITRQKRSCSDFMARSPAGPNWPRGMRTCV